MGRRCIFFFLSKHPTGLWICWILQLYTQKISNIVFTQFHPFPMQARRSEYLCWLAIAKLQVFAKLHDTGGRRQTQGSSLPGWGVNSMMII